MGDDALRRGMVLAGSSLLFALGIFVLLFGQKLTVSFEAKPESIDEEGIHRMQQFWRLDSYLAFMKWAAIAAACSVLVCSVVLSMARWDRRSIWSVAVLFLLSGITFLLFMMQFSDRFPPFHLHRFSDSPQTGFGGRTSFSFVRFPEVESTLAILGFFSYVFLMATGIGRMRRRSAGRGAFFRSRYWIIGGAACLFSFAVVQWFTIQKVEISYFLVDAKTSASPMVVEWSQSHGHWIWRYLAGGLVGAAILTAMRLSKSWARMGVREWMLVVSATIAIAGFPLDVSLDHQPNEIEDRGDHWYHSGTMEVTLTEWPAWALFGYVFFFSWLGASFFVDVFAIGDVVDRRFSPNHPGRSQPRRADKRFLRFKGFDQKH